MWQIRWEFVLFIRKILEIRRKFTWGEARFPPYTNESLAIRYPPMLLQPRNFQFFFMLLHPPQLPQSGKITDKLLLSKIIL